MGLGLRGRLAEHQALRHVLSRAELLQARLRRRRPHPFDRHYRIETQAHFPAYLSRTGDEADRHLIPYAGCVSSALRRVLATLPPVDGFTFLDLGCGKGRALVVASEAPFRQVIGVELLPELVAAARRNAARVLADHPGHAPISVRQGDASRPDWPAGPVVAFLYHPFDGALVDAFRAHVKAHATGEAFIIYENPVHGELFDADDDFTRWFSGMLDYAPDEVGLGFDAAESMVVWRFAPDERAPVRPGADRRIEVVLPGLRAVVAPCGPDASYAGDKG